MILLTILVHLCLLSPVVSMYRYPRAACNIAKYHEADGICELHLECTEPTSTSTAKAFLACGKGSILQHSIDYDGVQGEWKTVTESECNNGEILISDDVLLNTKANSVRCVKEKGCDLTKYPQVICSSHEECEVPRLSSDGSKLECGEDFQLEGVFAWSNYGWRDIDSITCTSNQMTMIVPDRPNDVGNVHQIRCMKLKPELFYHDTHTDCKGKDCKKPATWSPEVTCEHGFILEVATMQNNGGEDVVSSWGKALQAVFKKNKFIATTDAVDKKGKIIAISRLPKWFRCSREQCSSCFDPCPTCTNPQVTYNKIRNWDVCQEFSCGPNSRTLHNGKMLSKNEERLKCTKRDFAIGYSTTNKDGSPRTYPFGRSEWTSGGKTHYLERLECQFVCTTKTPLKKQCVATDDLCDQGAMGHMKVSDDTNVICRGSNIFYKSKTTKKESEATQIQCDLTRGVWKLAQIGANEVDLDDEGIVFCRYKCDSSFCPLCVKDDTTPGKIHCPPNHSVKMRNSPQKPFIDLDDSTFFTCKAGGKWQNDKGQMNPWKAKVECVSKIPQVETTPTTTSTTTTTPGPVTEKTVESSTKNDVNVPPSAQQAGFGAGTYMAVFFAILVVILVVTCVVFKVRGKGWLHTIVLEKFSGGKKETKNKKKKKGGKSKKADSPGESVKKEESPGVSGKEQTNGESPVGESPAASTKAESATGTTPVTGTPGESNKEGGTPVETPESKKE